MKKGRLFSIKRLMAGTLFLCLLCTLLPATAFAADSWTEYGPPSHASASGDTVSFRGHEQIPVTAPADPMSVFDISNLLNRPVVA
jgi:hypothetical protein